MKTQRFIQIAGWLQLVLSVLLVAGSILTYRSYRSSLGDLSKALADSILSSADVIGRTAKTLKMRQDLIANTTATLISGRKLVEEAQRSAETQGKLASSITGNVRDASAMASQLGHTVKQVGDGLFFSVPSGVYWHGVTWSKPLETQGKALQESGERISKLSGSLDGVVAVLSDDVPKLQSSFIAASRDAIKLLDETAKATEAVRSDDLPKAIEALERTSADLRKASEHARSADQFVTWLLIAGLTMGALCACNSMIVLLLAKSMEPLRSEA